MSEMRKCSTRKFLVSAVLLAVVVLLASCSGPRALRAPHGYTAEGLAFSPEGTEMAVVFYNSDSREALLELREWPSLKRRRQTKIEGAVGNPAPVTFSPDGVTVAVAFGDRVFLYGGGGEELGSFPLGEAIAVMDLAFTPKRDLAILVSREGQTGLEELYLERYDLDGTPSVEPRRLVVEPELWGQPFSPGGRFLVYVDRYETLGWMDLATDEAREWDLRQTLGVTEKGALRRAIWPVAVHPQGTEVALGLHVREAGLPMVLRLDTETGEILEEFLPAKRDDNFISALAYSQDGSALTALAHSSGAAGEMALYLRRLPDGEPKVLCEGREGGCGGTPISFSPDGGAMLRGEGITFQRVPEGP